MMIVYSNEREVIVTTPELEPEMLSEYFKKAGRDLDDYDRTVSKAEAICLVSNIKVEWS